MKIKNSKLREGKLHHAYLTDEQIWRIFSSFLSSKSVKQSTYKYALMKSMIENLYEVNGKLELTYDQLAYTFAKVYWNLVAVHGITQHNPGSRNAKAATLVLEEQNKYNIPQGYNFDKLSDAIQCDLIKNIKQKAMKENVFGALYGDTRGNFYEFAHKGEYFRFDKNVYTFMLNYQSLLIQLTNYHMAKKIEELNGRAVDYLIFKVEDITKRGTLKPFEKILLNHFEKRCFYCDKELTSGKRHVHVDHFVPWSFVQSDQIWNLVLSCSRCNTTKNDKLAIDQYLEKLQIRNEKLITISEPSIQTKISNYDAGKIEKMYEYSRKNGFDDFWTPVYM
ncbi:HNH endonuclease domain-containing protein [Alteribacter aurantiacus]|uniref:HNH endonuclease domain-containing protein n=1 Tax=Alteribacter aurantiacus TaxID=254410 RepID=UPI000412D4FF|nr:HNH endonuclease domain-containing protein [Alteribacter aurantiacus]